MGRPKLTYDKQIAHMKEKGYKFNGIGEGYAQDFITNHTYYFKIKSYAKNYDKDSSGKYIDLEFAYLKELSTIDMYLRYLIVHMCLDVEHFLKVKLLKDFNKSDQDGYEIIEKLFEENTELKSNLQKKFKSTCKDLIEKHSEDFAVWNIIEVISFGDLVRLLNLFYGENYRAFSGMLESVRCLRNAASHSNCLLNSLKTNYTYRVKPSKALVNRVSRIKTVGERSRVSKLGNPVIHDIAALLFVYDQTVISKHIRDVRLSEMNALLETIESKAHYFQRNVYISSFFEFLKKILDYLGWNCI
jgi:abortive infection bacteriophage resistance protein